MAGCVGLDDGDGFVFAGFLPGKVGERAARVSELALESRAVVLLEAPHRINELAQALAVLAERRLTVARELTKQFEAVTTMPASAFAPWLAADANHSRGEFVVVLHPAQAPARDGVDTRVLSLLLPELPLKSAVRLAAEISGQPRNSLYAAALALKAQGTK